MASDEILSDLEKGLKPSSPSTLPSTVVGQPEACNITGASSRNGICSLTQSQYLKGR